MSFNITTTPKANTLSITHGTTFGGAGLVTVPAGIGTYLNLTNTGSYTLTVQLNGDSGCQFTIASNTSVVFHLGDINFSSFDFSNTLSGSSTCVVDYIYSYSV